MEVESLTFFIEKLQRFALLRFIILFIIGCLLIFRARQTFNGVIYFIAGYLAFLGLMNLWVTYREKQHQGVIGFGVTSGVLLVVAALAVLLLAKPLVSLVPIIFGVLFVIQGLTRLLTKPAGPRVVNRSLLPGKLFNLAIILAGILLIFNPFATFLLVARFVGVILIFLALDEAIRFFLYR